MRETWTETTLGEAANVRKGKKPPVLVSSGELSRPYLTAEVLRGATCGQFVPEEHVGPCVQLNGHETVLLWDGAGAGDVFRAQPGVLASTMAKLETRDSNSVDDGFLYLYMNLKQAAIKSSCRGTTVPHVSPEALKRLGVSIPPLAQQKRIVDLVSSLDSYIAALQQQADAARTLRTAAVEQVLADGDNEWGHVTMGEVLSIARGGSPRPIHDYITASDDGVNWIKIGDAAAHDKYIYSTIQKIRPEGADKSRRVFPGDFLLSNSMSFGRPYILRTDGCIHDGWLLLSGVAKHFDEDFLYNVLMSHRVQQQFNSLAAGSGVRNLNIDVASEVRIPLPPIDVQKEIGSLANSIDDLVLSTEQTLATAVELRAGVVSELLSGAHEIPDSYDRLLGAA